jgi:hypothetical protein
MQSWLIELKAAYLAAIELGNREEAVKLHKEMEEAVKLHKEMETYEKIAK